MKSITVDATLENLEKVQSFIEQELEASGCPVKAMMQISMAAEEIYVNIAHYAYKPGIGKATIICSVEGNPLQVILEFWITGVPLIPLLYLRRTPPCRPGKENRRAGHFTRKKVHGSDFLCL